MPIDCHIKIEGVESESVHKDHKGEIDVLSWSWSVSQPSAVGSGVGGQAKGKAIPGEFVFTHRYDKASPVIAKHCAQGKHFPTIVCTARQAGEGQKDFLKITLKECMITSAQPSAAGGGEIMEAVALSYVDIEFDYKPMDEKGNLGGSVKFGWNVASTETR
jgi:type VI secretion system secreted protein Hcp